MMQSSEKRQHIVLVGFMGSGKSTVGPLLAARLDLPFVDLDDEIEKVQRRSIEKIFSSSGEVAFRQIERRALRKILAGEAMVLALGGGAFQSERNREAVQQGGVSIWLEVSLDFARSRSVDSDRPLARDPMLFETLYHQRLSTYQLADLHVEVGSLTPDQVAETVLNLLERS
jgi:shikimate kinase